MNQHPDAAVEISLRGAHAADFPRILALNAFEVQQTSEVTYRLYDYGRPRELHLGEGVAVARGCVVRIMAAWPASG